MLTKEEKKKEYHQKWQKENPHKAYVISKRWKDKNKAKVSAANRKYRYGITNDEYLTLRKTQNGKCAICDEEAKELCIDHCHTTDKIRGLLCHPCNRGIGYLRDNEALLSKAANYIRNHK